MAEQIQADADGNVPAIPFCRKVIADELAADMAKAQAALDAASKLVVDCGKARDAAEAAAKEAYGDGLAALVGTRDKTLTALRVEYKAKLAAARTAETRALNALAGLQGKQAKDAARAKAGQGV